jgi:SAM-dependent methyltransferase
MRTDTCRVCLDKNLALFLDLGTTALANSFVRPDQIDEPEPKYPLRLVQCQTCGLVQIDEIVPPETLFRNYIYVSGTSDLIRDHARFLASHLTAKHGIPAGSLMVEAASNDGTVIQEFGKRGLNILGIDPAANIVERANAAGIRTACDFFNAESAARIRTEHGAAHLILARHVLAHVADLHAFVAGFRDLLHPEGIVAIEVPYLGPFHDRLEFDTVYHEHLCYFSLQVLVRLFASFDLEPIDAQEVAIHGGSLLLTLQHKNGPRRPSAGLAKMLQDEKNRGWDRLEVWRRFATAVAQSKQELLAEIDRLIAQGRVVAGYGAPAKGMTLLAYCGIDRSRLPYLFDKSPYKQGLLTPGHHIPIFDPREIAARSPDVLLLLAWNFADEIVRQQAEFGRRGRFLLPLPSPHYWKQTSAAA